MPSYANEFGRAESYDHDIVDGGTQRKIGTLRVTPVSVKWKPANQQRFFSVRLEDFTAWITGTGSGATRTVR